MPPDSSRKRNVATVRSSLYSGEAASIEATAAHKEAL